MPLYGRATEILEAARTLVEGTSRFLFPNRVGKQLEEKQLLRMFRKHNITAVPHGFRSSVRDWVAEKTDHPREVIEAALPHAVQTEWRRRIGARTYSTADVGSWTIGRRTWPTRVATRTPDRSVDLLSLSQHGATDIRRDRSPERPRGAKEARANTSAGVQLCVVRLTGKPSDPGPVESI